MTGRDGAVALDSPFTDWLTALVDPQPAPGSSSSPPTSWLVTEVDTGDRADSAWSRWIDTRVDSLRSDLQTWLVTETGFVQMNQSLVLTSGLLSPFHISIDGAHPSPDPDPPTAQWIKPLIGAGGGPPETQWDPLDGAVGPMLARRSYDGNLPSTFASCAAASDVAAGRHSYWSWKPSVTGFPGSSSQKAALASFLATIPQGHKVTIFAHHEPENDMPQDFTIEQWGALQDSVATIVRAAGNPNIRFGPCFMGPWTWDSRSPYYAWIDQWATVMDWSLFDVVGIDPYASIHPGGFSLESMLTVRNSGSGSGSSNVLSVMAHLSQFDVPIGIVEWGYYRKQPAGHGPLDPPVDPIPPEVVASWITDAYDWFLRWNRDHPPHLVGGRTRGPFVDCALWFNYSLLGADTPLTGPLSNPTTVGPKIDAYAAIVADSKIPPTH